MHYLRKATLIGISGLMSIAALGQKAASDGGSFAGSYADLKPEQKRIVDDWTQRFSRTIKKPVNAADLYDNLPLSQKTTFNAITHALLTTKLTDSDGKALGPAIQIIDKLDKVAGKVDGASGDSQFRIYIQLKPGAQELLSKSKEFSRGPDNTVFHKGYPICFRSKPFVPSIQVSMARDGRNADIDVDYRSSRIPVGLVNGHLTASNSDVRAGKNDATHNSRWEGLPNWWRSLLGLPMAEEKEFKVSGRVVAKNPKITAKDKPQEAVNDFLSSWLIENKPENAMAYFDPDAFLCMEVEQGKPIDRGMAQFAMLKAMQAMNARFPKTTKLEDVSMGVPVNGPRVKVIPQSHEAAFVLFDVREDLAENSKCINKVTDFAQASEKALQSKSFGKYVGAAFRLKPKNGKAETVATLWEKHDGYWKLISYDVDPALDKSTSPDLTAAPTASKLEQIDGDPEMTKAATEFMKDWLIRGKVDQAFQYLSPKCYSCLNLYLPDDKPAAKSNEQAGKMLLATLKEVANAADHPKTLSAAVSAPSPHHPDFKLVRHAESDAFVIVSLPDEMAVLSECSKRKRGDEIDGSSYKGAKKTYGHYYATGFSLGRGGEDAGVLWTVWTKENGQWKMISYVLLTS